MRTSATARHGDTLVVLDNERRLSWQRPDHERWVPVGVWPDADEAREVSRHLSRGLPLLVVLEAPLTVVSLLAEEFAVATPAVVARVVGSHLEPVDVHLPALDWLPAELGRRGHAFLAASTARWAAMPRPLRPSLVLDAGDASAPHVRFAHRVRCDGGLDTHLAAIVEHVFGPSPVALAVA